MSVIRNIDLTYAFHCNVPQPVDHMFLATDNTGLSLNHLVVGFSAVIWRQEFRDQCPLSISPNLANGGPRWVFFGAFTKLFETSTNVVFGFASCV